MSGKFVVIGQTFETALLRLSVSDRAYDAAHRLWPPVIIACRSTTLMHPDKRPFGAAQAILAVEGRVAVEMRRQCQLPMHQIVGVDTVCETAAGGQIGGEIDPCIDPKTGPVQSVLIKVPGISNIPRRFECGGDFPGLFLANAHPLTNLGTARL